MSTLPALTGFVLAGGKSSRMGRDKALLDWHGHTLVDHMTSLLKSIANPVLVVGRDPLPDKIPGLGPLSGVATGLENSSTDANLFVAVDLPHLTKDFFKYLRLRLENSSRPMLACKIGSDFPLCIAVWRPILPEIQKRLAAHQLSVRGLLESGYSEVISDSELAVAGISLSIFRNLNTPEDYASSR